jgi:hypothetical protein
MASLLAFTGSSIFVARSSVREKGSEKATSKIWRAAVSKQWRVVARYRWRALRFLQQKVASVKGMAEAVQRIVYVQVVSKYLHLLKYAILSNYEITELTASR